MNVQQYKNIILPLLIESYDEREAGNLFKYALEDYFKKRYFDVKDYFLSDEEVEELNFIYEKISNHYPVQYIFKKAHFYGMELYVDEHVLIPRPETEELVNLVLSENESESESEFYVLDIGTGSGCISIALKKNRPGWIVYGSDISEEALKVAERNAKDNDVIVNFINMDILNSSQFTVHSSQNNATVNREPLTVNIIVSNPPYIPVSEKDKMSASAIRYEPHIALFTEDNNPLLFYNKIADFAQGHLSENGKLYFELNEFNANDVKILMEQKGFHHIEIKKDLAGKDRMLSCQK